MLNRGSHFSALNSKAATSDAEEPGLISCSLVPIGRELSISPCLPISRDDQHPIFLLYIRLSQEGRGIMAEKGKGTTIFKIVVGYFWGFLDSISHSG